MECDELMNLLWEKIDKLGAYLQGLAKGTDYEAKAKESLGTVERASFTVIRGWAELYIDPALRENKLPELIIDWCPFLTKERTEEIGLISRYLHFFHEVTMGDVNG